MAYSATTVLPALVCADTKTLSFRWIAWTETCWNGSSVNLYSRTGFEGGTCFAMGT